MRPQSAPTASQVCGVQCGPSPQTLGDCAPQTCPEGQTPQLSVPPQPLPMVPQLRPCGHCVSGWQPSHWLGMPFLMVQICPAGQVPHCTEPPQPSPIEPQPAFTS